MTSENKQGLGCAAPRPEVGNAVAVDEFDAETKRLQTCNEYFHTTAILGRDVVAGNDLPGQS